MARILGWIVILALVPSTALAQSYTLERERAARSERSSPRVNIGPRAYAGQCYAWCPEDHTPCDPANFKMADGRCRPAGAMGFSR
jgi:hypothetical protein